MGKLDSYMERKAAALAARRADFTAEPSKAAARITATSKVAGITGARPTQMGSYTIISDSAPGLAGHALGPTAPELLLGALASCLVHTYLIQACLHNIPLDHVEIEVAAKLDYTGVVGLPVEETPRMRDVTYAARVESSAAPEVINAMHEAVEAACPVLQTFRCPVEVSRVAV